MATIVVASVVMGLLALAVALYVGRGMEWRSYVVPSGERRGGLESVGAALRHPAAWALGFFLLVFGAGAVALAAVGAISLPLPGGNLGVAGPFALMLVVFVGLGTYGALRARRRSTAESVVVSLVVLATLFLLGLTANLVVG
jgi:hypothetical protein